VPARSEDCGQPRFHRELPLVASSTNQVSTHSAGSLLQANVAIAAGDDGFQVRGRSTRLNGNRAVRNADLGIEAVRGVIGGGNIARDNGDPRQCTNIFCR
jgi:hypothetical protein